MKPQELVDLGLPKECLDTAFEALKTSGVIHQPQSVRAYIAEIVSSPILFLNNEYFGTLAKSIIDLETKKKQEEVIWGKNPFGKPTAFVKWGNEDGDLVSNEQMQTACELPVAVKGALMPDYHPGYGLPIGGVLATYNSVVPYAVGVDIACRMRCTITDLPVKLLEDPFSPKVDTLIRAITGGTVFGVGGRQKVKEDHPVMDQDWNITRTTKEMKDRAWSQLGTSGSGNHFVEFGIVTIEKTDIGLEPGQYVALLSHSGSRGAGSAVCKTYSDIARSKLPKIYERFINLAWLSLDSEAGQEYWHAMNLMGDYASANHQVIHKRVLELAKANAITVIENHHNFAWLENGLVVHRKGATPAGEGVLGVIPGSMADPAFIVRGKGNADSINSASHGAGRKMSRTQAIKNLNWANWKSIIKQRGVRLLSAGLDEVPGVYKNILDVMKCQTDLVDIVARFDPKLVKMSDDGKSED